MNKLLRKIFLPLLNVLPDKVYIKILYLYHFHRLPDLKNPQTFNEKLQWLKLHDRRPEYTMMVDKYLVKEYVAKIIGKEYIIPTIGVWDSVDDIDWDSLPNQYILKWNHDSGSIVICKDKRNLDIEAAKNQLRPGAKRSGYWYGREWPYKNVKPCIITENYMVDESGTELKDYKFFCFEGRVKCMKVDFGRFREHHANYYDAEMNLLNFGEANIPPVYNHIIEKPKNFEIMVELAEKLSNGIPFIRVDFYNINGKIYFGELTLYPASGMGQFTSKEWDRTLGDWIKLPINK